MKVKAIKGYSLFPKKEYTLITTEQTFDYNDYVEWAELCNDGIHGEDGSVEFNDWCADERDINIECDFDNLRYLSKYLGDRFVIEGWLGLWWGHPEVEPVVMNDLMCAISKCIRDCNGYIVSWENGIIKITAYHHDGTNIFEISALSAHGINKYEKCEYNGKSFCPNADDKKRIPYPYHINVEI